MSLFGSRYYGPEPNFTGLFRLIDDFDNYRGIQSGHHQHGSRRTPVFTPKFDLRETETAYELHGELPGLDKKDVQIEFTDPQTLLVRGRVERSYTSGTPPSNLVEGAKTSEAIEAAPEAEKEPDNNHHATVEDANEDGTTKAAEAAEATATESSEVTKHEAQPAEPKQKYWVSERSIGEFSRSFQFPSRVDTDAVTAGLDNGILTVTVPKARKHESRRIDIL